MPVAAWFFPSLKPTPVNVTSDSPTMWKSFLAFCPLIAAPISLRMIRPVTALLVMVELNEMSPVKITSVIGAMAACSSARDARCAICFS